MLGAIAIEKRSEEEILKLIKKTINDGDGETALEKVNDTLLEVFSFRPKILGFEVDVNALLKKLRGKSRD